MTVQLLPIFDVYGIISTNDTKTAKYYGNMIAKNDTPLYTTITKTPTTDEEYERFHVIHDLDHILIRKFFSHRNNEHLGTDILHPNKPLLLEAWLNADYIRANAPRETHKYKKEIIAFKGERLRCPKCKETVYEFKKDITSGDPVLSSDVKPVGKWPKSIPQFSPLCPNCGSREMFSKIKDCIVE